VVLAWSLSVPASNIKFCNKETTNIYKESTVPDLKGV